MKEIKLILVAVDESRRSGPVVEKAMQMAHAFAAKILLVYVRPKVLNLGQPYYQQLLDKYIEHADNTVAPHKALLEQNRIDFEELVLEGDPAEMILEAARIEKCDLIVMGTRGLSNIQGLALGSVSNKVLHAAPCMVLMVP